MKLNNQQILRFVERVKLPREKKADYESQINGLKSRVVRAIGGMPNTKVVKVRRAGSWKKGTALRPRGDMPLDVDLVFFVNAAKGAGIDWQALRDEIIAVLKKAYPNKSARDFTNGKKTVGIVFRGSGLEVDIVPFAPDKGGSSYGRQPKKKLNSGDFKTSVDKQLDFISGIKGQWPSFAPAVRMVKWWKNRWELELPSFAVELVFAYLIHEKRIAGSATIERGIMEFFEFISAGSPIRIKFPGAIGRCPPVRDGVPIIADPTNNENNVMEKTSRREWEEITDKAGEAFETITYARQVNGIGGTVELWREVFEEFNIQEA